MSRIIRWRAGLRIPPWPGWMSSFPKPGRKDIFVVPIAHHNLLAQSRMYTTQCAMDNNEEVIELLQKYRLPLFFSGHLHVQRVRKYKAEPGVPEEAQGYRRSSQMH